MTAAALTFFASGHPRCGAGSPARALDEHARRLVIQSLDEGDKMLTTWALVFCGFFAPLLEAAAADPEKAWDLLREAKGFFAAKLRKTYAAGR